jgi:thiol peroxidase
MADTTVICVSKDSPFAFYRFCDLELTQHLIFGSQYKDSSFSDAYGVDMISGTALEKLMSRAVVVISPDGIIEYTEQVQNLSDEPSYKLSND